MPCIEKETPEIFDGGKNWPVLTEPDPYAESIIEATKFMRREIDSARYVLENELREPEPDLCVCGPVTRAQGVCECGT